MKLNDLCIFLDSEIPLSYQENYDNSGLQVGDPGREINSALLTVDVTEEIVDEAVRSGCDLIVSHHPLIFNGLKRITDKTYTERIIIKAIKNDIAIYSAHTNLDVVNNGVSRKAAEKLDLTEIKILQPLSGKLLKLVSFIPESHYKQVSEAVFEAGAGVTGNYDMCAFSVSGTGSFRAGIEARPFKGEKGRVHFENEIRFETVLFPHLRNRVIRALLDSHPYEEVAYDLITLENEYPDAGAGRIGKLKEALSEMDFLSFVSGVFGTEGLRHSALTGKKISRVALCGGSGSFLLREAVAGGADAFITGDIKYHTWFDTENKILLIDTGHFESEKFSAEILYDIINKKFPKFALRFSKINTNPINYFNDGKSQNARI